MPAEVEFAALQAKLRAFWPNARCARSETWSGRSSSSTTHPFFALQALTDGNYDPLAGEYRTRLGEIKHYAATDHLEGPGYSSLTPDDLLDVVSERGLGWDGERDVGVALHTVSALAVAGRIRLTAIGDSLEEARALYYGVKRAVDEAASSASV